jgi:pimeloyl-ACP methyl ester carboxylesterase
MDTLFTTSQDGKRVAYDVSGKGPAIILLHGGGSSRREWNEAGYVARLSDQFTVITLDLRGHGESSKPTDPADYTTDKMGEDILAVADERGVKCFTIWGMSFGGNVGRYLAVRSERVVKIILMGSPMGLGVSGELRQLAIELCAHWPPILQALDEGSLDIQALSKEDQDFMRHFNVVAMLGWVFAMLDWPAVDPSDIPCPALWLIGSQDKHSMERVREYNESLDETKVQLRILEGLDHEQVFSEIDRVLPIMLEFTKAE